MNDKVYFQSNKLLTIYVKITRVIMKLKKLFVTLCFKKHLL